jgi:DNA-binding TFAR19-related protein (PDSD5 family)
VVATIESILMGADGEDCIENQEEEPMRREQEQSQERVEALREEVLSAILLDQGRERNTHWVSVE